MTPRIEEEWISYRRGELQHRYGVGTFVAVYDWAVIDWGDNAEEVRQRAEAAVGETVFVAPVPADPPTDIAEIAAADWDAHMDAYRAYSARIDATGDKRRYRLDTGDAFHAIADLDITGQKTDFVDGVIIIDGVERRYADHDHRLMIERGIVSEETELIAGIIYWKQGLRRDALPKRFGE